MFSTCSSLSSQKIQGNNSKRSKKFKNLVPVCSLFKTFLFFKAPSSPKSFVTHWLFEQWSISVCNSLNFIFTAVVLISCIGSFIIFRQWAPIIKIRSSLLRTLTMLYEETYIAIWFNLREGSSIKKIIKKQRLMKIARTNRYRRQSKNLNQSLEQSHVYTTRCFTDIKITIIIMKLLLKEQSDLCIDKMVIIT